MANGADDETRNVSITGTVAPLEDIGVVIMRGDVLLSFDGGETGSRKNID